MGWDCIIIPGAFGPTDLGSGKAKTTADIQQTLLGSPTSSVGPSNYPPQICGSGGSIGIGENDLKLAQGQVILGSAVNHSICTKMVPFTLEFMSDDLEGHGLTAAYVEYGTANHNTGYSLLHEQIACPTSSTG